MIDSQGFDYQDIVHLINKNDHPKLQSALETVLRKFTEHELMLAGDDLTHIEGLLRAL